MRREVKEMIYGLTVIGLIFLFGSLIETRCDRLYLHSETEETIEPYFYKPELDSLGYYDKNMQLKPEYFESDIYKYMIHYIDSCTMYYDSIGESFGGDLDYEICWEETKKHFNL